MESEDSEQGRKRPRNCEPDVTIVVGGIEFQHYKQVLCMVSEYFDGALNSGMIETGTKRIEFPDKDPDEWIQVAKFFDHKYSPSAGTVTDENVHMLLPWFDFLGMSDLLRSCEDCLRQITFPDGPVVCDRVDSDVGLLDLDDCIRLRSELALLCESFTACLRCSFMDLLETIVENLVSVITKSPDIFTYSSVHTLVSALAGNSLDPTAQQDIWNALRVYLPESVPTATSEDRNVLLTNPLLEHLILKGMESETMKQRDHFLPKGLPSAVKDPLFNLLSAYPGVRRDDIVRTDG